ncbi:biotin synthase auxiliary protein BsaP [Rhodococcus aerolatus]
MTTGYCPACGAADGGHDADRCAAALQLEPPRFCAECGRRMVVQVRPHGWHARCSRHGELDSASSALQR